MRYRRPVDYVVAEGQRKSETTFLYGLSHVAIECVSEPARPKVQGSEGREKGGRGGGVSVVVKRRRKAKAPGRYPFLLIELYTSSFSLSHPSVSACVCVFVCARPQLALK